MIFIYISVAFAYYGLWQSIVGPVVTVEEFEGFVAIWFATNFIHREIMKFIVQRRIENEELIKEDDEDLS